MGFSDLLTKYGAQYFQALLTTWRLTAVSFAGAFIIGILITVARVSPIRPLRIFGDIYVQVFRNIPEFSVCQGKADPQKVVLVLIITVHIAAARCNLVFFQHH